MVARVQQHDAARADSVDAYIARVMQAEQIPGFAVAIIRDGRLVLARGYGYANLEHQVRVTPSTVFQSRSLGKAFTVMAVLMLIDDGLLNLDDPLSRHFPDAPEHWRPTTVRHLLEHTSGIPGYPDDFNFRVDRTEDELYEMIRAQPLAFTTGERRGYSNLGFVLLGILIHTVTGTFYGEVLDMAKWEVALNAGHLLARESYARMWSPLRTNDGEVQPWGFSWQIEEVNGQRIVEHSGGWQGFTANVSRYPAERLTVSVFLNLRAANPIQVTRGIQNIYQPELSIAGLQPIAERDPAMATFVRSFVQRLTEQWLAADLFVSPVGDELLAHADEAARTVAHR